MNEKSAEIFMVLLDNRKWALLDCSDVKYIETASEPTLEKIAELLKELMESCQKK
jgi:hypothetical protein